MFKKLQQQLSEIVISKADHNFSELFRNPEKAREKEIGGF